MRKKDTCTHACRLGEVIKSIIPDRRLIVNKKTNKQTTEDISESPGVRD